MPIYQKLLLCTPQPVFTTGFHGSNTIVGWDVYVAPRKPLTRPVTSKSMMWRVVAVFTTHSPD